jgi:hypothetical protein
VKAKILKRVTHNGKVLETGDIVDVSGWRNARSLSSNRYIAFIEEEVAPKVEDKPVAKPKAKVADKLSQE